MAIHKLSTIAAEQGTYVITATFRDETDVLVSPDSMYWTLVNKVDGIVINGKLDVEIAAEDLASSITIVLSGDDLARTGGNDGGERRVLWEGTYTSTIGSNLPFTDEVEFAIQQFIGVG